MRFLRNEQREDERQRRSRDPEDDRRIEIVGRDTVGDRLARIDQPAADDVLQPGADIAGHSDDPEGRARGFARHDVDGHQPAQAPPISPPMERTGSLIGVKAAFFMISRTLAIAS